MRCALFSHHSMPNLSINLPKKFYQANIQTFHHISAAQSTTSFRPCLTRIPTRGQTSTKFSNTQLSTRESKNYSMSRTSRMSFLILSFTTKTSSINLELSRRRRKLNKSNSPKKRQTRKWPRRKQREMRSSNKSSKKRWRP